MAGKIKLEISIYEAAVIRNLRKHRFAKLHINIVNGQPVMMDLTETIKFNEQQALDDADRLKDQEAQMEVVDDDVNEYNKKVLNGSV